MKTRCPNCGTRCNVEADAVINAGGLARCHHCEHVFDALNERITGAISTPPITAAVTPTSKITTVNAGDDAEQPLPFDVPENLQPLQASPDAALDIADTLYEKPNYRSLIYGWLVVILTFALGLQLAWQHRLDLLARFPQLQPLCDKLACEPKLVHAPNEFQVLSRNIKPAANEPGALTLSATVRNAADAAQVLPDIQLSLLDNNGAVLIRRRLAPSEYLFPPPSEGRRLNPGEVITINVDFKDPGYLATGFMIDFL